RDGGRTLTADDEVTIDTVVAAALDARVGDTLSVEKFGDPVDLRVVGVARQPPLGAIFERKEVFITTATMSRILAKPGRIKEIDILVKPGADPNAVAAKYAGTLEKGLLLQPTAKITSGLQKNLQSNQVGFTIATILAFMAAAFIIMTGLTTN